MVVKILNQETGKFRLFGGDDIDISPSITFPRNDDFNEAEDDLGVIEVHCSFPSNVVLATGDQEAVKEMDFALVQILKGKVYKNIVVDRTHYDIFVLEEGKTIEHL